MIVELNVKVLNIHLTNGQSAVKSRKSFLLVLPLNWEKNPSECKASYLNPSYLHVAAYFHPFVPQQRLSLFECAPIIVYLRDFMVFGRCHWFFMSLDSQSESPMEYPTFSLRLFVCPKFSSWTAPRSYLTFCTKLGFHLT